MATTSVDNPSSIFFKNGQLKPGIYKIQNVYAQTYMDIHDHSKDVCCRPATALAEGRGLWEIKPLGAGYSVQRVPDDPGIRLSQESLSSFAFRYTGWETNVVQALAGLEYIRFFWETTELVWDLSGGSDEDGKEVLLFAVDGRAIPPVGFAAWRVWKLIPVKVEGA